MYFTATEINSNRSIALLRNHYCLKKTIYKMRKNMWRNAVANFICTKQNKTKICIVK